jgi:hypothetical protein
MQMITNKNELYLRKKFCETGSFTGYQRDTDMANFTKDSYQKLKKLSEDIFLTLDKIISIF